MKQAALRRSPSSTHAKRAASVTWGSGLQRRRERLADRLELDPVEHVLEEAADDQALRFRPGEAARHEVEELLAVDLTEGGAVRAADVVRKDLESGDRVGMRGLREQEVAVLLVGVRLLRTFLDADHAAPDRARAVAQRPLKAKSEVVSGAMCSWNVS